MRKNPVHIFIATLLAILAANPVSPAELVNARAPDFALHSIDGDTLRLSEFRSEVVLLSFVSERCTRCRQSSPFFEELQNRYQADGLKVIGVDIQGKPESASHMVAELGLTFPVLLDTDQSVSRLYDLNQLPLTLLIDREGAVSFINKGFRGDSGAQIDAELKRLLAD